MKIVHMCAACCLILHPTSVNDKMHEHYAPLGTQTQFTLTNNTMVYMQLRRQCKKFKRIYKIYDKRKLNLNDISQYISEMIYKFVYTETDNGILPWLLDRKVTMQDFDDIWLNQTFLSILIEEFFAEFRPIIELAIIIHQCDDIHEMPKKETVPMQLRITNLMQEMIQLAIRNQKLLYTKSISNKVEIMPMKTYNIDIKRLYNRLYIFDR